MDLNSKLSKTMRSACTRNIALPLAAWFALIALLLFPTAQLGFISDAAGYISDDTAIYASHPLMPFLEFNDSGHPLVFAWINGIIWHLFGQSNAVANVSIWLYAAIALTAFQSLARRMFANYGRVAGWGSWLATLCLFITPAFIGNAAYYATAIPTLAFALAMIAAWAAGRRGWIGFWAVMLAFTRITGIVSVAGLAIADFAWHWLAGRRRGRLARSIVPYLAAPILLGIYLFIKMVVLGRPLSTYGQATGFLFDRQYFFDQICLCFKYTLSFPPQGVDWCVWPAAAGLALAGARRLWQPAWRRQPMGEHPGGAAIYAGLVAVNVPMFLLYAVHTYPAQPGWFLPAVALVVLAGIHGLFVVFGRWPALALTPALMWCVLQWAHASEGRLHRLQRHYPILNRTWATPPNSLDSIDCRRLNEQAARWIESSGPHPAVLSIWESIVIQSRPSAGFVRRPVEGFSIVTAIQNNTLDRYLTQARGKYDPVLLVHASWDSRDQQPLIAEVLARYPAFEPAAEFSSESGRWIRIYRWHK